VVTGISSIRFVHGTCDVWPLQWGPVVVTGISIIGTVGSPIVFLLQWGPVVVTGISCLSTGVRTSHPSFNGVRSW